MALHNPNNWHWVSKPVGEWTQQWFGKTLTGVSAEEGDVNAKITKVISMDGDVDVNQRKGKVITIYDVKLVLEYSGAAPGEEDVSGTITVPEVAHDTEEDEFVVCRELNVEWKNPKPTNIRWSVRNRHLFRVQGEASCERPRPVQDCAPATKGVSEAFACLDCRTWQGYSACRWLEPF